MGLIRLINVFQGSTRCRSSIGAVQVFKRIVQRRYATML